MCWACRFFCVSATEGSPDSSGLPFASFLSRAGKWGDICICSFYEKIFKCTVQNMWNSKVHSYCEHQAEPEAGFPTVSECLWIPRFWLVWGKSRLVLHLLPLSGNDFFQTDLHFPLKCSSCDKGTVLLNYFARKILIRSYSINISFF